MATGIFRIILIAGLLFALGGPSFAASDAANVDAKGIAIHGYDPVGYFTAGNAIMGKPEFTARHFGVTYMFSSIENLKTFTRNPEKYTPSYGGWCAYGVRVGRKFDIDPNSFQIVNGRLFLQLNLGTQKIWNADLEKNIEIADRLWPKIQAIPADVLNK